MGVLGTPERSHTWTDYFSQDWLSLYTQNKSEDFARSSSLLSVLVGLGSALVRHRVRALRAARSYCMHGSDDIFIARASRFGLRGR